MENPYVKFDEENQTVIIYDTDKQSKHEIVLSREAAIVLRDRITLFFDEKKRSPKDKLLLDINKTYRRAMNSISDNGLIAAAKLLELRVILLRDNSQFDQSS